jgi:acetyl/propionyl-CoA carboxylase alpha subunit
MRHNRKLDSLAVVELMQAARRKAMTEKADQYAEQLDFLGAGFYWLCLGVMVMWLWINW